MRKPIEKFWNSLDYWEAVNLLITIILANHTNMSQQDAYSEAVAKGIVFN
ncbi:hypothetical protein [Lentilactobacillus kisonensis]|nr:hypothetical protein [Lentilactobacillus kisonensis]